MFIKPSGTPLSNFHEVHPLSRIGPTRFAGSAFGLNSGTGYDFKLSSPILPADLFFSAITRTDAFVDPTNAIYHVSVATGNDSNNGSSLAQAFRTVAKALSVATAGSKVLLYDGIYYEGDLTAPRSGTASNPIVLQNAPGTHPILSGLDTNFLATWSVYDAANHVYRTPCVAAPENAYLNGGQFFHYQLLADLLNHPWNQPGGYYVDGAFLYARFPGDVPPGTNVVSIPLHTTGLTISQKANIYIRGLEFCYFGRDSFHRAIYIDGGDSNLVDHCWFHQNGVGVALKRAADFNTIQYCAFTEAPISTWSWHAVKDSGTDYEAGGVLVYGSTETNRGNVIRYCSFTNMFDGSHLYSDDSIGPTDNMDFHDNVIQGCVDDAIETDGAGSNCRIYFNRFHSFLTGISVAPAAIGPTYIFRNILSDWRPSEDFDGYPFKFNVSSSLPIQWVYLYQNTCVTAVPGQNGFWFKQFSNWTNVISRNNIFAGTAYALESDANIANYIDFDYDDFFTSKSAPAIRWAGTGYSNLTQFSSAVGEELHGLSLEPSFINSAAHDYYLPPASGLIDKGVIIPGINDDFLGQAPDLGALEFGMEAVSLAILTNIVQLDWHVGAFGKYQLQYSTNLQTGIWSSQGQALQAEQSRLRFLDPFSRTNAQRFYRLQHVGP